MGILVLGIAGQRAAGGNMLSAGQLSRSSASCPGRLIEMPGVVGLVGGAMNSWSVWLTFLLVAIVLGLIAYWFSLRVLRVAAAIVALATAAYLTRYGLTHPANPCYPPPSQAACQETRSYRRWSL